MGPLFGYVPGNKAHDQVASDSMIRILIDVSTTVGSYNCILIMVSEILGGILPILGQWSDPKGTETIGFINNEKMLYGPSIVCWMHIVTDSFILQASRSCNLQAKRKSKHET